MAEYAASDNSVFLVAKVEERCRWAIFPNGEYHDDLIIGRLL